MLTAKLSIDESINAMRSKQKNVVVLSTDLTMAYNSVFHGLLLSKLEHVGIRGLALKLLTITSSTGTSLWRSKAPPASS